MQDSIAQLKNRALQACRVDPKKTTLMSVLAVVLVVMIARMTLSGAHPAAALASLVQPNRVALTPKAVTTNRNAAALARWLNQPAQPISRNLFATRLDFFPTDNTSVAQNSASGDFWSQLGKSIAQATDEENKRENLKESFRQQAGKLRLQSTMAGAQPRAMLNGKLVSEGNEVEGFRVIRIDTRRVVLERQGFRFELTMK